MDIQPPPKAEVQFSELTLRQIDEFRWKNRLKSRAAAIRFLVLAGLDAKRRK